MKLVQSQLFNGSREFEIVDDVVHVRIRKFLKEEKITVGLSIINPEPVVKESRLEFYDRYKGDVLLSLLNGKPNSNAFNAFVEALRNNIPKVHQNTPEAIASPESERAKALAWNVYEEPPQFEENRKKEFQAANAARLAEDIVLLKTYLDEKEVKPLLDTIEGLIAEPDSEAAFQKLQDVFDGMGMTQGAVLTYAPYLKVLLSNNLSFLPGKM